MNNTGLKLYSILIEINDRTGQPTGRTKPNLPNDPDYIAPVIDREACPTHEFNEEEFSTEEFN